MKKFSAILLSMFMLAPALAFAQNATSTPDGDHGLGLMRGKLHISLNTKTGTVTGVSGNTITINATDGATYTVDATSGKIKRRFGAAMLISDIQVGDNLIVTGTITGNNVVAKTIEDSSLQARDGSFTGSVMAVSGSSFTLQSKGRGNQTVNTSSSTVFKKGGVVDTNGMSDIVVGLNIQVNGVWNTTNNNITAKTINIIVKKGAWTGKETSVSGTTLNFTGNDGAAYTVDTSAAKIFRKYGAAMLLTDIVTGDMVNVHGTLTGTNIVATEVRDMSQQQRNANFSGKVTAVNGTSFTLQTYNRGAQTINTSSTTVFNKNGAADSNGIADVTVGATVAVNGIWDSTANTVAASKVNVIIRMVGIYLKGTVQSVSGNTITVLGSDNATYTLDATTAKIVTKNGTVGTVATLQNGDSVVFYGKHVSGSLSVTVTYVRDTSR